MNEDATLLCRFVEDHAEEAFTELVRRHFTMVHATALRRVGGDAHLAQDVAQLVFISLARKASSLRRHGSLAGWLYISTHHASAELVRREKRRKLRDASAHSMHLANAPDGPPVDPTSLRLVLDDVLVELKRDDCDAVVLRFFAQHSFAEIGATLKISGEAARKRVERALSELQTRLSRRGISSTVTAISSALTVTGTTVAPAAFVSQVANLALAQNLLIPTASLTATLASLLAPAAAIAVALTGLWTIIPQHRSNEAMANEIARLERTPEDLASLRSEIDELSRVLAQADVPPPNQITTTVSAHPAFPSTEKASPAAQAKTVLITTEGTLQWEGDPVSLDEFLLRLTHYKSSVGGSGSRLVVQGNGVQFPQLNYVLDEARKAGITTLVVESDSEPDPAIPTTWF